ncbi:MAG: M23 family metallopeptidase, partial [Candidatus Diapherotrites archaeon]|nr:M23 family metallopeptidase [Candidatus Diapherotrites archaeon]
MKIPDYTCPVKHVKIGQGQFSQHSHKKLKEIGADDSYAVDFLVPEGTTISAAADGTVIFV